MPSKSDDLNKILLLQKKLLKHILHNGTIEDMIDILSNVITKDLVIIDHFYQIVAKATKKKIYQDNTLSDILSKTRLQNNETMQINKSYWATPFTIYSSELNTYHLIVFSKDSLDLKEIFLINQVLPVFSVKLYYQINIIRSKEDYHSEFVNELLFADTSKENLSGRAALLNFNIIKSNTLMIFDFNIKKLITDSELHQKKRLCWIIRDCLKSYSTDNEYLLSEIGENIILLLPYTNKLYNNFLKTLLNSIKDAATNLLGHPNICVGVSYECKDIKDYRENYYAIKNGITFNKYLGKNNFIVFQKDLGINELFFELFNQDKFRNYAHEFLNPIIEYEKNKDTPLLKTAEIYLKNMNLQETSKILYTHINTIRYRLAKIGELLNINLKSPEDCFKLSLAINIHKFDIGDNDSGL